MSMVTSCLLGSVAAMYEYRLLLASYRIDELIDGEVRTTRPTAASETIAGFYCSLLTCTANGSIVPVVKGDQRLISVM